MKYWFVEPSDKLSVSNPPNEIWDEPETTPSPFVFKYLVSKSDVNWAEAETIPSGRIALTLPAVTVPRVTKFESPGYWVASDRFKAGVASFPPSAILTPPIFILFVETLEPSTWTEPLITPLGKIESTLPLVTVPTVVMFPCVKCSFASYPVVDDNVIWDEPLTNPPVYVVLDGKVIVPPAAKVNEPDIMGPCIIIFIFSLFYLYKYNIFKLNLHQFVILQLHFLFLLHLHLMLFEQKN